MPPKDMKLVNLLFLVLVSLSTYAQKLPKIGTLNRVILNLKESIFYAQLLPEKVSKSVGTSIRYWYIWCTQHDIKETKRFSYELLYSPHTNYYENTKSTQSC